MRAGMAQGGDRQGGDRQVPDSDPAGTDRSSPAVDWPVGPLISVSDPADDRVAQYRDLNDPQLRRRVDAESSIFVVEGKLAVAALLDSPFRVRSLLVDERQLVASSALVESVRARGAPVYVAPPRVVTNTVGFALHRGVVAIAHRPAQPDPRAVLAEASGRSSAGGGPPLIAVLEGLNDHQNIGSLFRNAAAFGVAALLIDPTCADPLYRRSVRVSLGHVLRVPFARLAPWPTGLCEVRAAGFTVVALVPHPPPDRPTRSLSELAGWRARTGRPLALMVGAEGPGLSGPALAAADGLATIPMASGVDSLNVATAAAVAFHRLCVP